MAKKKILKEIHLTLPVFVRYQVLTTLRSIRMQSTIISMTTDLWFFSPHLNAMQHCLRRFGVLLGLDVATGHKKEMFTIS